MATKTVVVQTSPALPCTTIANSPVILCLTSDALAAPIACPPVNEGTYLRSFIEGTLVSYYTVGDCCNNTVAYKYTIQYDDAQLADPTVALIAADITGIFCTSCLTTWVEDLVGSESYIRLEESGSQTFISEHGCEYPINNTIPEVCVTDSDTIDFSIGMDGCITGSVKVSADFNNAVSLHADGVYAEVSPTNKNLIIGGDFFLNPWQRGVNFVAIANGNYAADRFLYNKVGTMVHTLTKTGDGPSIGASGVYSPASLDLNVTTAEAVLGMNDVVFLEQHIEGYNYVRTAQQIFTLSFWVTSAVTGIYSVAFVNSGLDRSYVSEYTINAANTWEKKTITVSAPPSTGTWDYSDGKGLTVIFCLAGNPANTNASASLNTWLSSYKTFSTNQVNSVATIGNHFKINLVQLEVGPYATLFEQRFFADELRLCERYYTGDRGGPKWFFKADSNNCSGTITFPAEMRATPSVFPFSISGVQNAVTGISSGVIAAVAAADIDYQGFTRITKNTGPFAGDSAISFTYTADAELS